jgi:hypothetical protein
MMQLARRTSLVIMLLIASVGVVISQEKPKAVTIEEGTRHDGGVSVKFIVSFAEQVPPGASIVTTFAKYGEGSSIAVTVEYYYAGISQGTVHIFRITREVGLNSRETERRPILLPLDATGSTVLFVNPHEGRPFTVRLRRASDGVTLAASVVK